MAFLKATTQILFVLFKVSQKKFDITNLLYYCDAILELLPSYIEILNYDFTLQAMHKVNSWFGKLS